MDTCSNCGATVRPGARFCTACGTRLNDVDSNSAGSVGWGESAPVEDTPAATEPPVNDADDVSTHAVAEEGSTTEPVTSPPPATAWTWGSTISDDPAERTPISQTEDDAPDSSGATTDEQHVAAAPASSDTFQWSWGSFSEPEAAEPRATDEPSTDDTMNDRPSGTADASERGDVDTSPAAEVVETGVDDSIAEDQSGREAREAEIADMPPPYDWRQSVSYGYEEKSTAADNAGSGVLTDMDESEGTPAVFADSDGYGSNLAETTDLQARATALIDELRSLIPALGLTAAAEPVTKVGEPSGKSGESFDTRGVIEDLESASRGISTSDDLRSVLEAAQSRPRDMDVILDLVGRAGSLLDLLDERDRLAAAIERALASLR